MYKGGVFCAIVSRGVHLPSDREVDGIKRASKRPFFDCKGDPLLWLIFAAVVIRRIRKVFCADRNGSVSYVGNVALIELYLNF